MSADQPGWVLTVELRAAPTECDICGVRAGSGRRGAGHVHTPDTGLRTGHLRRVEVADDSLHLELTEGLRTGETEVIPITDIYRVTVH